MPKIPPWTSTQLFSHDRSRRQVRRGSSLLQGSLAGLLLALGSEPFDGSQLQAQQPAVPEFRDGQSQVVGAFKDPQKWIRHDLWVETDFDSDGDGRMDRMHVAVTRPQQTETEGLRLPVIYETSPYFAGTSSSDRNYFWNPKHELGIAPPPREDPPAFEAAIERPVIANSLIRTWVPRGFIVVHSSSPGTGLSEGCPTVGGDNESLAPKAVIDWLCGRAKGFKELDSEERVEATWSTGKVGMIGTSYNGTLPLAAATTGVEGLEAIVPVAPNTSYYHYYRSNGLVRHPGGWMGEDIDVLYNFIHSGNPARRGYCDCEIRDREMAEGQDRITGDYNDFWATRDYLRDLGPMKAAMFMAHAFNDWNVVPEHSIRIYSAVKAKGLPVRLYMHQGGHGGDPPLEMVNRWFTHFLHGIENDVLKEPEVWIVREQDKREAPTSYAAYPHPDAEHVTLFPQAGGVQHGPLTLARGASQGTEVLVDNYSFKGEVLAQAPWTNHRLLYLTPPLARDVHLSGYPRIQLRLASNKAAANLSVWLVSLPWSNSEKGRPTDNLITRGWADPQNTSGIDVSEPLVPGRFYDVQFDLQPDDQIIPQGKQIGLMVFSSDQEFTLHPPPGTELTIDLDATALVLPIVGGQATLREAFTPPPARETENRQAPPPSSSDQEPAEEADAERRD